MTQAALTEYAEDVDDTGEEDGDTDGEALELPPASELRERCRTYVARRDRDRSLQDTSELRAWCVAFGISTPLEPETVQTWSERGATLRPRNMLRARTEHERHMERIYGARDQSPPEVPGERCHGEIPHPAFPSVERAVRVPPYHPDDCEDTEPGEEVAQIEADLQAVVA